MSSNISVIKVCQHCKSEFTARTNVTKFCGVSCTNKAYRLKKKQEEAQRGYDNLKIETIKPIVTINEKQYLSVLEACNLLSISRTSLWRAIKKKEIHAVKIGRRTLFKRTDLDFALSRLLS